jgi:hypothetical protein
VFVRAAGLEPAPPKRTGFEPIVSAFPPGARGADDGTRTRTITWDPAFSALRVCRFRHVGVVHKAGVEPARASRAHRVLSAGRLPFRHLCVGSRIFTAPTAPSERFLRSPRPGDRTQRSRVVDAVCSPAHSSRVQRPGIGPGAECLSGIPERPARRAALSSSASSELNRVTRVYKSRRGDRPHRRVRAARFERTLSSL